MIDYNEAVRSSRRVREYFKWPGVIRHSTHTWRGGKSGPRYVDFDFIVQDPMAAREVVSVFAFKVLEILNDRQVDFLGFIEKATGGTVGALQLAGAISIQTGIPTLLIRPSKELLFERVKHINNDDVPLSTSLNGVDGVIITDHCSEGHEALQAIDIVQSLGAKVTDVITFTSLSDQIQLDEFEKRDVVLHSIAEDPDNSD